MIELSAAAQAVITRSWVMHTRVESWLGEELLADDVPVSSGTLEEDRSLRVPERVTIKVPRLDCGTSWDPTADTAHPLAPYGQRLRVSVGVELGSGAVEWVQRGWYVITDVSTDGDAVGVEAAGLLHLIDEARFVSPFQPTSTVRSTLRALVEPALTVDMATAPADRSVPSGIAWDEDRLGAVLELLDAWPGDAVVSPDGVLTVGPGDDSTTPVLELTDATGGTVVSWAGSSTRDDAATVVVARGQTSTGAQVQGVAYEPVGSPTAYDGPFNPLPVPYFYFSPLLTTRDQCRAAAAKILARRRRAGGRRVTASAVPHPGLQAGDTVAVTGAQLVAAPCVVETVTMPLTADSGPMQLELREVS